MSEPQVGRSPSDPVRDTAFKRELVTLIPHLRAFARTLTGDPTAADDLAQDAMMKAWDARASFQLGTNMKAWTFMILRNQFYSEKRRSWRQSQLDQEAAERTLVAVDDADQVIAYGDLEADGHIDHLYCSPEAAGSGAAGAVLDALLARAEGLPRLYVEASELARGLFERKGFVVERRRDFEIRGVAIHNYAMARRLEA